ncbi:MULTISPECIES: hypothetical protein [Moorena]|uniref:hypothetical protein n=1 Tax=Moorena TaxID=1155738 RepID=UPI0002E12E98|nr:MULTISPECIES: hypothetical protein [Moorena]NEP64101.1 hypothetical protein [Moorena sp. SIO3A5]
METRTSINGNITVNCQQLTINRIYSISHSNEVHRIGFRFPIPDSRFPIPDSRFPFPSWEGLGVGSDSRFPIPDSRFPIPDSRSPPGRG